MAGGGGVPEFALVGYQNGLDYVESVMTTLDRNEATSYVGALTLRQTARAIADCDFFLGTDGGLMHCAIAMGVPGIAIFGKNPPELYLPPQSDMQVIYDPTGVNSVQPSIVAEAILN